MRNPPWDSCFFVLLNELDACRCDEALELLADALEHQTTPSKYRLDLLNTYCKYNRQAGIESILMDLGATSDDTLRSSCIYAMQEQLDWISEHNLSIDPNRLRELFSQINVNAWPSLTKGFLGCTFENIFPDLAKSKSSLANRVAIRLISSFDLLSRLNLGCLVYPIIVGFLACILVIINESWSISRIGVCIQLIATLLWALFAIFLIGGNSGKKTPPKTKLKVIFAFFAVTGIFFLVLWGIHFVTNYFSVK